MKQLRTPYGWLADADRNREELLDAANPSKDIIFPLVCPSSIVADSY